MRAKAVKVAVSLAADEYRLVESERRARHVTRSAVVAEALRHWFEYGRKQDQIRAYVEGYRKLPESAGETTLFENIAAETLAGEEWEE
ncbi:MAG: ribbon-helix-helix protein, CopG family [Deltaproteobacteria bacterium]|nr:ribbon-helix-helix protein, CopG family [Deltaproteobacteria bacterium]